MLRGLDTNGAVILGINLSHDMSCAAVVGGEVKVAVAEERLNRVKHCSGVTQFGKLIPYRSIRYCCESLGIDPGDVDLFVVNSCRANALEQLRAQLIGIPPERVRDVAHPGHHLAHAYSAFYCSGFDESAVLVTDTNGAFVEKSGGGLEKKEHFTSYHGTGDGLRVVDSDDVLPGFQGGSEFGPRALGHRSFLASPAKKSMRDEVNRLKKREWYRPVAPVVPRSELARYFAASFTESPYMTLSSACRPITRRLAPAVVHVDGTARPQTVTPEEDPLLHRLLVRFGELAGIPILINTSLNVAGEPIVETPDDALDTFEWAEGVSHFLIGDSLVEKRP